MSNANDDRRALGRGLGDILGNNETDDQSAGIPRRGDPLDRTPGGIRSLIRTGEDFGPYFVEKADTYYQGPSRSTRVAAHQFIPLNDDSDDVLGSQFLYWQIQGYIYVRFHKKNTLWRYGPCSLHDYRIFRESASKGRSVESLEAFGHGPASGAAGLQI